MNRYSDYKFSGIDWLGNIPSHWILTKNRFGFKKKTNGYNESIKTNVLSLTTNGIKIKNDLTFGKTSNSYIGHQLVKKGDMVFTPRDFDQTPILSDVSEFDGCISNLYIVDETNENVFNHYVNYFWYGLKYSVDFFKNFSNGMRYSFNRFQFDEIPLLVPPIQEQKLISNYLDKKMGLIDSLIEKIKKKIELFKEQRASMINQFVTKGLYPNAEVKDSGVDWIGDIPKHWEVSKLKYLSSVELSTVDRHKYENEKKVSICHYTDTYKNEFIDRNTTLPIGTCKEIEFKKFALQKKDIILTKDSESPDDIGIPTFVLEDLENTVCGYHLALVKTKDDSIIPEFLYRYIESKSVRDYFFISSNGITRFGLGKSSIRELIVVIPPKEEQVLIIKKIQSNSKHINEMIKKLLKKIELLKEYNQSILSSVVTGKIRVSADKI